jgi:DNA-directed RNA polymerase subunit M/transcription elongation factor TFIIS
LNVSGKPSDRIPKTNEWPNVERRSTDRPQLGDRRECPSCGAAMRFYERHLFVKNDQPMTKPAWICRCGYEEYVRRT